MAKFDNSNQDSICPAVNGSNSSVLLHLLLKATLYSAITSVLECCIPSKQIATYPERQNSLHYKPCTSLLHATLHYKPYEAEIHFGSRDSLKSTTKHLSCKQTTFATQVHDDDNSWVHSDHKITQ